MYLIVGIILILVCIVVIIWSFREFAGIYQLPFFVATGFLVFITPQIFGVYASPYPFSLGMIDRASLMSIMCVFACCISYIKIKPKPTGLWEKWRGIYSLQGVFLIGLFYTIIGNIFFLRIGDLDESQISSTPTGILTIFIFLGRLIYPGFALLLISTLRSPNIIRILVCLFACLQPIARFVFFGRRSEILIFLCIVLLSLFFIKKIVIPKFYLLSGIFLGLIFGLSVGQYRNIVTTYDLSFLDLFTESGIQRIVDGFSKVDWLYNLSELTSGEKSPELRVAISAMEATERANEYGFGATYWNTLIFRYIPAQFLGAELKNSLYLPSPDVFSSIVSVFGFQTNRTGLTITCVGELFIEFWFFGSLIFCLMSSFYKNLWVLATAYDELVYQAFYCLMLPFSIIAIGSQTSNLLAQAVYYVVCLAPVAWFTKVQESDHVKSSCPGLIVSKDISQISLPRE